MKYVFFSLSLLLLTACHYHEHVPAYNSAVRDPVNPENPASEYCYQQGGYSEIRSNGAGTESRVCVLPDGKVTDEFLFYQQNNHDHK
ncbi:MAG: DUF333 domain-containing protein [Cardiobacteriaceae bacterium]|nr:DUF333 domain-containing protein [Cardiobacteriaceae bacterium]